MTAFDPKASWATGSGTPSGDADLVTAFLKTACDESPGFEEVLALVLGCDLAALDPRSRKAWGAERRLA